jgi:heat-inducible transcriptional repressor
MAAGSARDLSPREREILRDIIQSYILTGEPVSSRSVAKLERHGLSAASIRNIMADLEEDGYLAQPHTSAGRVPTRAAYHLYIQALMQSRAVSARERRYIEEVLRRDAGDAEQLLIAASHVLSELSGQVAILVTPDRSETRLLAIDFLPLSGSRVLAVVVSSTGFVDNKVIELDAPLPREELVRIANYLTDHFGGLSMREIRDRLLQMMADERAQVDRLLGHTLALASKGLELEGARGVLVEGAAELLAQPELASVQRVRRLFDTFADKARLVRMLNECMHGAGLRVFIGEDSDLTSSLDFSLVATRFGAGDEAGKLAVFGPSRMEYPRVIPLVHYLSEALSKALATHAGRGGG